jgi:hypothetical protein
VVHVERLQTSLGALHAYDGSPDAEVLHLRTSEQLRRLQSGDLGLGLVFDVGDQEGIERERLFAGEPLAAFLPTLGPDDLRAQILLIAPRAVDPALHDRLLTLTGDAGYRFRAIQHRGGADLRDVLFSVAEGRGIGLGPVSTLRSFGDLGTTVVGRPLNDPVVMPDTMLAWPAARDRELDAVVTAARVAARRVRASTPE